MNLDYALTRLSLALESVHPLGWFAAGQIVNEWFSFLYPLMALVNKLPDIPGLQLALELILELLFVIIALVGLVAMVVLMIGSAVASIVCVDLDTLLGHAIATWHALGGA